MAKQRKPPGHDAGHEARDVSVAAPDVDPALVEQGMLGNAALQARLGGEAAAVAPAVAVERAWAAEARALVTGARQALMLRAADPEVHARRLAIVEASRLSDERKEALLERLEGQQLAALDAEAACASALGALDAEGRAQWVEALAQVAAGLATASEASVADPAAWVGERVATIAPSLDAAAATALCRAVLWQLHLEEDEEEEEGFDYATEESGR